MTPKKPLSGTMRNIQMNCRKNASQNQDQQKVSTVRPVIRRWIYHHDHAKNVVKCLNHVKYVLGFVHTSAVVVTTVENSMQN